ncbi:MAG: hypothetical protein GTN80_09125 [Nitrososphaeria archaeon]|nr:hypothetical protein [Nitrososphaeria archaeon]NIN53328.1 hypothetical protein [Nitrososphaeria archaeon]NIQ33781.1 hypothetical protein [Nitrososphaeria archaeon]
MVLSSENRVVRTSWRVFHPVVPNLKKYRAMYDQSGISLKYEAYLSFVFLTTICVCAAVFGIGLVFPFVIPIPGLLIITGLAIPASATGGVLLFLFTYPLYKKVENARKVDDALLFTVGYAGVLASAGLSLERLLERISEIIPNKPTANLLQRVVRNVRMFGHDIAAAIEEAVEHTASRSASKLLVSMLTAAQSSGELKSYLVFEAKQLFLDKKENLERTVTSLTYIGELYIAVLIVGPIVLILMIALLSSIGGTMLGLTPVQQMNLIVFIGLPFLAIIFIILIDMFVGRE